MARKLGSYEWRVRGARDSKYPWDEWLDGSIWEITEKDLKGGKLNAFTSTVQNAAKRRGLKVRVNTYADRVVFQAFSEPKEPRA